VRIPVFLAVAQWMLLLALGLLVVVMYRQLGRVLGQAKPAELGPRPGSNAARFGYARAGDQTVRQFTPGNGQAALVAFVDPTCPSCEQLVTALGTAGSAVLLASHNLVEAEQLCDEAMVMVDGRLEATGALSTM